MTKNWCVISSFERAEWIVRVVPSEDFTRWFRSPSKPRTKSPSDQVNEIDYCCCCGCGCGLSGLRLGLGLRLLLLSSWWRTTTDWRLGRRWEAHWPTVGDVCCPGCLRTTRWKPAEAGTSDGTVSGDNNDDDDDDANTLKTKWPAAAAVERAGRTRSRRSPPNRSNRTNLGCPVTDRKQTIDCQSLRIYQQSFNVME